MIIVNDANFFNETFFHRSGHGWGGETGLGECRGSGDGAGNEDNRNNGKGEGFGKGSGEGWKIYPSMYSNCWGDGDMAKLYPRNEIDDDFELISVLI